MSGTENTAIWDAIIVGGRPAGATLAARLGKRGLKVLVLDRDRFPSLPAVPSSPTLHPGAMKVLDEMGVDEASYSHVDGRIEKLTLDFSPHFRAHMTVPKMHGRDYLYGIDRAQFDGALWKYLDRSPGVTKRDGSTVSELLRDADGRVNGVVVETGATSEKHHARCVIGADGRFSMVARKAGAEVTEERNEHCSTVYYANWKGVKFDAPRSVHILATGRGTDVLFFPMPGGLTSLNTHQRADRVDVKGDAQTYYQSVLMSYPGIAERLKDAKQVDELAGIKRIGNGYRTPSGPGWALVGDALHYKDPVDGQGIYDALVCARALDEALASFLVDGKAWDIAMAAYAASVKRETGAMYNATCDRLKRELYEEPPTLVVKTMIRWMMTDARYQERFLRFLGRDIPAETWLTPGLMMGAMARGVGRDVRGLFS